MKRIQNAFKDPFGQCHKSWCSKRENGLKPEVPGPLLPLTCFVTLSTFLCAPDSPCNESAMRVVSRQSPLVLCLSGALGLYVDAKPSFLTPTCFVRAQREKRRCRLTRRESQRVMNSQGRGQLHPASVVTVHIKCSHRSLPSNADRLQIFYTSRSGTNGPPITSHH